MRRFFSKSLFSKHLKREEKEAKSSRSSREKVLKGAKHFQFYLLNTFFPYTNIQLFTQEYRYGDAFSA
jgi:hypothetical protein